MSHLGPLLSCFLVLPMAAAPLTLPRAMRQAGEQSQAADTSRLATEAARQDVAAARAQYLPGVQVAGGYRVLDERAELLSPPLNIGALNLGRLTFPTEDKDSWRWKLSIDYLAWDFGKRASALEAARSQAESMETGGHAKTRQAQREAADHYLALLNLKAQKEVIAQRRQALEDHLRNVKAQFEHGVVARNDLLRTEVTLRQVEDSDRALDRAYASGLEALNVAIGEEPDAPQELPGSLPAPPACPLTEKTCRPLAAENNEVVRALQAKVKADQSLVDCRRRDYFPSLVVEAGHAYVQNSYLAHNHENELMLGLTWKVFDGARSARVQKAEAEKSQSLRELLEARRNAENGASLALRTFNQALQELETAQANVKASEENLRIVQDQYQEGLVRNSDVLDAESVLAESRSIHAERRYRAYSSQIALLAVLGEDLPAFYEKFPFMEK